MKSNTLHTIGPERSARLAAVVLASLVVWLVGGCERNATPEDSAEVGALTFTMLPNVAVTVRDGVTLRADVYKPEGEGPFPVLLYRTPYNKVDAAISYDTHLQAVARGYAVVLQDVRGRYASDGFFEPYRNEGRDGFDSIAWAASQSWSNGKVGTFGLSYPGAVQWLAAIESPPQLVAMAPAMTYSSARKFFYMNGAFDLSWLPWIYQYIAPDARARLKMGGITTDAEAVEVWPTVAREYDSYLPLAGLPFLRDEAPYYFEWLRNPPETSWWDWAEIRGRYHDVDAAVLNLSGWHDDSYGTEGAATNFNGLVQSRIDTDDKRTRLILGPWRHGVGATAARQVGELDFGPDAPIDYDEELLQFFDRHLLGKVAQRPQVRYFIMGENRWHESETWPPQEVTATTLCFGTQKDPDNTRGNLGDCETGSDSTSSHFVADPTDPVHDPYDVRGPHDYAALGERDDVLEFSTEVLQESVTIAGNAVARVFVSCDCRDFDLWVRMLDVYPDGRAMNLLSPGADFLRASYRDIENGRALTEPGTVYELVLDGLLTANRFAEGHQIRLQVSATFAPHLSRNLQTGESEVTSAESRAAEITIHHGGAYSSALILPVLPDGN